jgi:hypothetical protein
MSKITMRYQQMPKKLPTKLFSSSRSTEQQAGFEGGGNNNTTQIGNCGDIFPELINEIEAQAFFLVLPFSQNRNGKTLRPLFLQL